MAFRVAPVFRSIALLSAVLAASLTPLCAQAAARRHVIEIDPARMLLELRPSIAAAEAVASPGPTAETPLAAPLAPKPAIETTVRPYQLTATATGRRNELECLAAAIHYEAANQGEVGQEAVAQVVLNRLNDPRYPNTVCGVVFQGSTRSTGCQFTFTCDGALNRPPSPLAWKRAEAVAEQALDGYVMTDVGAATHYHTVWVHPYWSPTLVKVATIGAHIFYRSPGARAPGAMQARLARVSLPRTSRERRAAITSGVFTAWGLSVTPPPQPSTGIAW